MIEEIYKSNWHRLECFTCKDRYFVRKTVIKSIYELICINCGKSNFPCQGDIAGYIRYVANPEIIKVLYCSADK